MRLLINPAWFVFVLLPLALTPAFAVAVDCSNYPEGATIQTLTPTSEPNPAALIATIEAALFPQTADVASIDSAAVNEAAVDGVASIFSSASSNTLPVFAYLNDVVIKEGCTESVKALLKEALDDVSSTTISASLQSIDTAPVGQLAACIREAGL